jgi:phage pi2 protein 07
MAMLHKGSTIPEDKVIVTLTVFEELISTMQMQSFLNDFA